MRIEELTAALRNVLPEADIRVADRPGGRELVVVSAAFAGCSLAERARTVYTALGAAGEEPLPALFIHLRAPDETGPKSAEPAKENCS